VDYRTCGPMDKATAYGAGDSRFDPWHVHTNCGKCKLKHLNETLMGSIRFNNETEIQEIKKFEIKSQLRAKRIFLF
jgi:hypothetical protein